MADNLALYCKIYPASPEKKRRVVELLQGITPFYRTPEAKCTTWCYFTPSQRFGALSPTPSDGKSAPWRDNLVVAGLEVYSDKSSLSTQLNDPVYFQPYQKTAKAEELYSDDEKLVAWYPAGGFLSRDLDPVNHAAGMMVIMGELVCKKASRDTVLRDMARFARWYAANEPDTLSYSLMTRRKAPNEILVFERYRNSSALVSHVESAKCKDMSSLIRERLQSAQVSEWEEVDCSFVAELLSNISLSKV